MSCIANAKCDSLFILNIDISPIEEISTPPTQRRRLRTGSQTTHDSMFRWRSVLRKQELRLC